jgi:hypothetical protein
MKPIIHSPIIPRRICTHHFCRCMRANELAYMGMLLQAIQVHRQRVWCRKQGK